ncbi:phosphonate ABC transporter, permease protein PhnE [Deinococcus oregonensis]|uniref:Phosphonate ABC transporter, permease protein PhnE n=1 Tax=Deinococcus oregonensis TaxID=1805970 RepID=A0ABV6AZH6_9DEIO
MRSNRVAAGVVLLALAVSYPLTEISPAGLISGLGDSVHFVFGTADRPGSGFFPPNFSRMDVFAHQMLITVGMGLWGTVLCLLLAVPLSFAGAQNVAPHWLYLLTRPVLDFLRGLPDLVLALIFVAALGLGPFPGIMALAVSSAGSLAKLLSEAIEAVDEGQIEAVRASGASELMVLQYGFWPQILPAFMSLTLYRFEVNVRAATFLGIVGAGGIGFYLQEAMRGFDFRSTCAIILIILITVRLVDWGSARLRARII